MNRPDVPEVPNPFDIRDADILRIRDVVRRSALRRRRGTTAALVAVCLLLGVVGGAVGANAAGEPQATQTVTASPQVQVQTVTKAPRACVSAIAGIAKVSLRQFKIIDLYHRAFFSTDAAALQSAESLRRQMTEGTAGIRDAADTCVKAAKG